MYHTFHNLPSHELLRTPILAGFRGHQSRRRRSPQEAQGRWGQVQVQVQEIDPDGSVLGHAMGSIYATRSLALTMLSRAGCPQGGKEEARGREEEA